MHIDILNKCILLMTLCHISDKIPILRSYFTLKNSIEAVQAKIFKVFILCFCHHYSQIAISSAINFCRHYSSFKTAAEMAGQNCKILCAIFSLFDINVTFSVFIEISSFSILECWAFFRNNSRCRRLY